MSPRDPTFYEIRHLLLNEPAAGLRRIRSDRKLLDVRSGLGETLLHWLAVENQLSLVQALIDLGAEEDPVNNFGSTPLLEAAQLGLTELCLLLLAKGAQVSHKNEAGTSVIASAVHLKRHVDLIHALLGHVPSGCSLSEFLDDSDIFQLSSRDDLVAQVFQKRGLPPVESFWGDV